jgi:A/G-specific adenine glycosylase
LTDWYKQNLRDLPWRKNKEPYLVWISEIILQQTRVDQGTNYFLRFIEKFPTVETLAQAQEDEVLKLWQGLGYYSRARNIHFAAKQIQNDFKGQFPSTAIEIEKLKGVGKYTAAAIGSISFNLPMAAVDGNVYRVLSRVFGISTPIDSTLGKHEFAELAQQLIDAKNPGTFNEALMEFGALQCVPKNPNCVECPFNDQCVAHQQNTIKSLPVKSAKTKVRNRYFYYLYIKHNKSFYITQRKENDIWKNLYQLPLIETVEEIMPEKIIFDQEFQQLFNTSDLAIDTITNPITHLLSHQKLNVRFIEISVNNDIKHADWIKICEEDLVHYGVPKVIENFLAKKTEN